MMIMLVVVLFLVAMNLIVDTILIYSVYLMLGQLKINVEETEKLAIETAEALRNSTQQT